MAIKNVTQSRKFVDVMTPTKIPQHGEDTAGHGDVGQGIRSLPSQRARGLSTTAVATPKVKQVTLLLDEIAMSAATIDRICCHTPVGEGVDALETQIDVMRSMVARIGWMADLGNKALSGEEGIKGDAEQWMMSPAYLETLDRASAPEFSEVHHG